MIEKNSSNQKERGQSMVELALTFTFLLILLAGTVDLGRGFFTWLALRDAAQEGASYGSFNPTDDGGMHVRIWDNLEQVIRNPESNVVINIAFSGPRCLGSTITVDVSYPNFTLAMPFLGTVLGSQTLPIRATINDNVIAPLCP